MAKQSVDARFLKGETGGYVTAGAASRHPFAAGGELGVFHLPASWATLRAGAVGLAADGRPGFLTGGVVGAQVHSPSRLAPYVGLSGFAGYTKIEVPGDHDGINNDDDWFTDERSEMAESEAWSAAIVPEVGIHYWLSGHYRLSIGTSYYFTTDGRNEDFVLFGITFGMGSSVIESDREPRVSEPSPELNDVLDSDACFRTEEAARDADRSIHIYDGRSQVLPVDNASFSEEALLPEKTTSE